MMDNFSETIQNAKNNIESFTDKATDTVATEAKNAFDKFGALTDSSGQTINNLTNNFTKAASGLNDATAKIKTSVLDATNGAVKTLTEASNQAASVVKETTNKATGALNEATNISVHKINDATTSISEAADKTKLALDATLHKAEQLSSAIANSVQEVISTSVQMWMVEHPAIAWIVTHPFLAMIVILLIFLVLWNLLNAIIKLIPQIFLLILKIPFISAFKVFQNAKFQSNNLDVKERLPNILIRLEELRQEQDTLMREMKGILASGKY
ncbi:hypothetical protein PseudUWO311_08945 [Pseudanabaena sp. UWO311]|uniref:hypothetical protein n=1 Tax=Pseudanabaena sp. UWO311 TaxID=2487337 RepID=UPI001159B9EA|nr:hypothetical protein [Pseudanabaena sp. UWO311]TYQ27438.1 hypothetical protein PseudUWO311_08945 [Pseudanabaena sp. UWO311]